MEQKYCQSCGMPLDNVEMYGTEADGSKTDEYCNYCYENGKYNHNSTMDEMDACAENMASANEGMGTEEAKQMIPYSTQIYGEEGIQMFIERFTALQGYAEYFDIDLEQIVAV